MNGYIDSFRGRVYDALELESSARGRRAAQPDDIKRIETFFRFKPGTLTDRIDYPAGVLAMLTGQILSEPAVPRVLEIAGGALDIARTRLLAACDEGSAGRRFGALGALVRAVNDGCSYAHYIGDPAIADSPDTIAVHAQLEPGLPTRITETLHDRRRPPDATLSRLLSGVAADYRRIRPEGDLEKRIGGAVALSATRLLQADPRTAAFRLLQRAARGIIELPKPDASTRYERVRGIAVNTAIVPEMRELVEALESRHATRTLWIVDEAARLYPALRIEPTFGAIQVDTRNGALQLDPLAGGEELGAVAHVRSSPVKKFAHELAHLVYDRDPQAIEGLVTEADATFAPLPEGGTFPNEVERVIGAGLDRFTSAELGERARSTHKGIVYRVASPVSTVPAPRTELRQASDNVTVAREVEAALGRLTNVDLERLAEHACTFEIWPSKGMDNAFRGPSRTILVGLSARKELGSSHGIRNLADRVEDAVRMGFLWDIPAY